MLALYSVQLPNLSWLYLDQRSAGQNVMVNGRSNIQLLLTGTVFPSLFERAPQFPRLRSLLRLIFSRNFLFSLKSNFGSFALSLWLPCVYVCMFECWLLYVVPCSHPFPEALRTCNDCVEIFMRYINIYLLFIIIYYQMKCFVITDFQKGHSSKLCNYH